MNRHRSILVAASVTAGVAGATLALAANVGLLGFAQADETPLGALEADQPVELVAAGPTTTTAVPTGAADVVVQYEDIYVQDAPSAAVPVVEAPAASTSGDVLQRVPAGPTTTTTSTVDALPAADPLPDWDDTAIEPDSTDEPEADEPDEADETDETDEYEAPEYEAPEYEAPEPPEYEGDEADD